MNIKTPQVAVHRVIRIHVKTLRRSCEHAAFVGACMDAFATFFHPEIVILLIAGKLALVFATSSVYLNHYEQTAKEFIEIHWL
jgi:hypothetical protein